MRASGLTTTKPCRGGRPHLEAFPAFDLRAAIRSGRAGGDCCTWMDEVGQPVGQARVTRLDDVVEFGYRFSGSANIPQANGSISLRLARTRRNENVVSTEMICSACERAVHVIYNVQSRWACRICHDLVYLKQRLFGVNKLICKRDELADKLAAFPAGRRFAKARHPLRSQLEDTLDKLGGDAKEALPQELSFRTRAHWGQSTGMMARYGSDDHGGSAACEMRLLASLAFLTPPPLPKLSLEEGVLVGSPLFSRSLSSVWWEQAAGHAQRLYAERPKGTRMTGREFVDLLVPSLPVLPIILTSAWSEPVESVSDDGCREISATADWSGTAKLWLAHTIRPWSPPTKAILSEQSVTVRVRAPDTGNWDMHPALRHACGIIERRLGSLASGCDARNAQVQNTARQCFERRLYLERPSQRSGPLVKMSKQAAYLVG